MIPSLERTRSESNDFCCAVALSNKSCLNAQQIVGLLPLGRPGLRRRNIEQTVQGRGESWQAAKHQARRDWTIFEDGWHASSRTITGCIAPSAQ